MSCRAPIRGAFYDRRSNFGSLAKFAAIRRASSRVSPGLRPWHKGLSGFQEGGTMQVAIADRGAA